MKILIVDDEVIIRTGLSTVIDWGELGFELLAPAASAEEVMSRILDERPHIMLTDIRMTGKNGLELASEVKKLLPDTEIIILTGYDDFSYTQQAIREGVSDYLLKTSGPKEIIKAAMEAKQRLLNRWAEKKNGHIQQIAFRDSVLKQLVMEEQTHQSLIQIEQHLPKLYMDASAFQVIIIAASGWDDATIYANSLYFAVENMASELLDCETLLGKDYVLLVVSEKGTKINLSKINDELQQISRKLKCRLFIAVGSKVQRLQDLKLSYTEALFTFSFKWFADREGLVTYDDVKDCHGGRTISSQEEEEQLIALLKSGDTVELRYWANQIISAQLAEPTVTPSSLFAYVNSIIISGHRWLERVRAMQALSDDKAISVELLEKQDDMSERPDEALYKRLQTLMDKYQVLTEGDQVTYIKRAMVYICEHLDSNLTLQEVAKQVHLNPNHFSAVFKRETGLTYIEYVTRERIRLAMELLSDSQIKVSDVARRVGYGDVKYFSQLFKKVSGKTPSEYRMEN